MRKHAIKWVIILGAITMTGLFTVEFYWLRMALNQEKDSFSQSAHIALLRTARRLADYNDHTLNSSNPVRQVSDDYFVVDVDSRIESKVLEHFLTEEFRQLKLEVDYEYGIYDCESEKMVYGEYISTSPEVVKARSLGYLPKEEGLIYYFSIRFHGGKSFFMPSFKLWMTFTAFALVSLAFFAYALLVILRQNHFSILQKDFINNMTHEFKTPISSIKIAAEALLNQESVQEKNRTQRYATIIREQNERLNHQVGRVLQIAQSEKSFFQLQQEEIELAPLLVKVYKHFEVQLDGKGKIDVSVQDGISLVADSHHLENILHSLLDNAVKYSTGSPSISFRSLRRAEAIILQVEDKGIGIAKDQINRVSQKFYRVPTGDTHDVKGFGLGLFYVQNICDKHGWKLKINSEVGEGTCVEIVIPIE